VVRLTLLELTFSFRSAKHGPPPKHDQQFFAAMMEVIGRTDRAGREFVEGRAEKLAAR